MCLEIDENKRKTAKEIKNSLHKKQEYLDELENEEKEEFESDNLSFNDVEN